MYCVGSEDGTGAWDRSQSWAYLSRGQPSSSTCFSRLQQLSSRGLLVSVSIGNFDCVSCQLGKQPVLPFNSSESISTDIFDLIHSDV